MLSAESVDKIKTDALSLIESAGDENSLTDLRVKLLGKKGELTQLMKQLGQVDADKRKEFGGLLNKAKQEVETSLTEKQRILSDEARRAKLEKEWIDVTLPFKEPFVAETAGSLHPIFKVQQELEDIFRGLGFTVVDGPEIEKEYYNFEALNIPSTHPARDMQDTIWTTAGDLLRTHTSSIQVRALEDENNSPPLRLVAPGKVFRYERVDASHGHTFYQMEGMMIDREVTVGHLIYFMRTLLREIFGFDPKIRLRPGYFPFVEPGFELDIWFSGKWMELLPCGLIHPKVLEHGGIDPDKWQGFAFGLGLSRLVMSRYKINDIRHLQSSDLRFLRQFS